MRLRPPPAAAFVILVLLLLVGGCRDRSEATSQPLATRAAEADSLNAAPAHPVRADSSLDDPVADRSTPVLTADGWGDLRIGMTRAQVVAAAGEDANPGAVGGPDPATCDEFRPEQAPDGLLVMIRDGRLSRVAIVDGTGIVTDRGIAVGDSGAAVEAAYGDDVVASPHAFLAAPAAYVTAWARAPQPADARGITYEVGIRDRVVRILAGDESIQFREGCV